MADTYEGCCDNGRSYKCNIIKCCTLIKNLMHIFRTKYYITDIKAVLKLWQKGSGSPVFLRHSVVDV